SRASDRRGTGGERRADAASGRVPGAARAAVRLLHARDADDGGRPARVRPAEARRGRGGAHRPDLPLYRLRADRRGDPESGGGMNLAAVLEGAAGRAGDREAVVDGELRLTYAQLRQRAARLAAGLAGLGLDRG